MPPLGGNGMKKFKISAVTVNGEIYTREVAAESVQQLKDEVADVTWLSFPDKDGESCVQKAHITTLYFAEVKEEYKIVDHDFEVVEENEDVK
jgi:hypothetical protein